MSELCVHVARRVRSRLQVALTVVDVCDPASSSTGLQDGEVEMKEEVAAAPTVDEAALAQLLAFGCSENACRRAVRCWSCSSRAWVWRART